MAKAKKQEGLSREDWKRWEEAEGVLALLDKDKAIQTALMPLDQVASRMEGKWGCEVARLVSPELAGKFGSAQEKLNAAIEAHDLDEVIRRAEVLIRGWKALDQAAEEAGVDPMPKGSWSVECEGQTFTVVLDRRDLDKVARMSLAPERVLCVNELLVVWRSWRAHQYAELAKLEFPGAQVVTAKMMKVGDLNDDIPF